LLTRNQKGGWVCSVGAEAVRPFWGRAFGYAGGGLLALVLLAGGGIFGTMRAIGYQVTLRQVFWPRAWSELRGVRAQLFVDQARAHYQAGDIREAMSALLTAHEVAPENYAIAMTLAQVVQAGNPAAADGIYLQMLKQHPEKRNETARVWMPSLLDRGRLADVAALASRQLAADPAQAAVWTHALIFSARHLGQPELLESAAAGQGVPAPAAAVLRLEAGVRRAAPADAAHLLLTEPLPNDFPYAIEQRTELLIEFGQARAALALLGQARLLLGGRDLARLALAAYAASGETATVVREADSLLAPARKPGTGEITLICQHLVKYPNQALLERVAEMLDGRFVPPAEQKREVWFNVLCAAGAGGDRPLFNRFRERATAQGALTAPAGDRLQEFFFGAPTGRRVEFILPIAEQMAVSVTYALLDRYWQPEPAKTGG
jgi:tetratricopeptide (TPR) repeat protein